MNKKIKIYIGIFILIVIIVGSIVPINHFQSDYKIILDGKEVKQIVKCDNQWNYQNLAEFQEVLFIPCVWNKSLKALYNINWTISPNENCGLMNSTFLGFNAYNETLAIERYNLVVPKCYEIKDKDIDEEFLKDCECILYCLRDGVCGGESGITENCVRYKCAENLVIEKR